MTNKNHKLNKRKKITGKNNNNRKESKKDKMYGNISVLIISACALVVSIVSLCTSMYYSSKEYEYKVAAEVIPTSRFGAEAYVEEGKFVSRFYAEEISIQLLDKNNLAKAYLIYPDNSVIKLKVDEAEEELEGTINGDIQSKKYDLKIGEITYQYWFLLLVGLDGRHDLTLIYVKVNGDEIIFDGVSGIEVWGLANSNENNPEYEGEKIMAEKYKEIINGEDEYL